MSFRTKTALALIALLGTAAPARAISYGEIMRISKLEQACNIHSNQKACGELARIATEEKDADMRRVAVTWLNDQPLLGRIAVEDSDSAVRQTATERLIDQALLAKIAIGDKDQNVCQAAEGRLADQTLLAKVAIESNSESVRENAVWGLTAEPALAKVATEDKSAKVREAATGRLAELQRKREVAAFRADQGQISKVAVGSSSAVDRGAAVKLLADQSVLAKIAVEDTDARVRSAATYRLTDQSLLAKIAVEDKDPGVRSAASSKLTDQSLLARIAIEDEDASVRSVAAGELIDEESSDVRFLPVEKIVILPVVDARSPNNQPTIFAGPNYNEAKINLKLIRDFVEYKLLLKHYQVVESDETGGLDAARLASPLEPEEAKRLGPPDARWVMVVGIDLLAGSRFGATEAHCFGFLYDKESGHSLWMNYGVVSGQVYLPFSDPLGNLIVNPLLPGAQRRQEIDTAVTVLLSSFPGRPKMEK